MRPFLRIFITLFLLGVLALPAAAAQSVGALIIGAPDIEAFPLVRFQMDAFDEQGDFLDNIQRDEVQILENGKAILPDRVKKIDTGLQIIFAISTAPSMSSAKDGVTEYQRVQEALAGWANAQPEQSLDDFSLSSPTGLFVIRQREPGMLAQTLTEYQPDLARTEQSLTSLAEALDLATDPAGRPGIKRSILYVTPPLPAALRETLPELTARAQQTGARVNVWMVGADTIEPNPLVELAETTGGRFFNIMPEGALPEIEPLFQSLRQSYEITYQSTVQKSGNNRLQVALQGDGLESNEQNFSIEVLPPNPIFLSPPASIERKWTVPTEASGDSILTPKTVDLQIVWEFPDRHMRDVAASRLYVNDQVVDENTREPFDRFEWPVEALTESGRHLLRVEVVDTLGLTGSSIEVPVDVSVEIPAKASIVDRVSPRGMITIGAIAVSGIALAIVLTLTGTQRMRRKNQTSDKKRMKDPVTQPVKIYQEPVSKPRGKTGSRNGNGKAPENGKAAANGGAKPAPAARSSAAWPVPAWPRQQSQTTAPARLIVLDENEQPVTGGAVLLSRQEITFGSDPRRATQVIESPTIDGLHARLFRSPDGMDFFLADHGSVAGTWVNYTPIDAAGVRLEHGDLIHIGRSMFRFELTDSARCQPAEVKVIRLEPEP